jgi:hypothetical protein
VESGSANGAPQEGVFAFRGRGGRGERGFARGAPRYRKHLFVLTLRLLLFFCLHSPVRKILKSKEQKKCHLP